jgi:hypothetical protein
VARPRHHVTGAGLTPDARVLFPSATGGRGEIAGVYVDDGPSSQADHEPLKLFLMKFRQVLQIEYAARRAVVGNKRQGESIAVAPEGREMYVAEKASMV